MQGPGRAGRAAGDAGIGAGARPLQGCWRHSMWPTNRWSMRGA